MEVPGISAKHVFITDECRSGRGDVGAANEALQRIREELEKCMGGWAIGKGARFHIMLTVERPARTADAVTILHNRYGKPSEDALAEMADDDAEPVCPDCGARLHEVRRSATSPLNAEQFEAAKAGDYFCDRCPPNDRGNTPYRYFWRGEIKRKVMPPGPVEPARPPGPTPVA